MWARPSRGWGYVKMTARRQAGTGDMSPPRRAETRTRSVTARRPSWTSETSVTSMVENYPRDPRRASPAGRSRAASSASAQDRRAAKELLTGGAASGQVGAHLADRRRVREFLDFRRRVERRVAHPAVWLTAVLLHGHTCDTVCDTPVGHQGLKRVLRQRPQDERSGNVMQQRGCNPFPRALACYRNPDGRMDLWIAVGFVRVR